MTKRMLVDATQPEEIRVAVVNGNRLEELDFETTSRKQLKGNIYLAKVMRVEPALQAAFIDYGCLRHGFLAFPEVHPDYYRIPVADREALLAEEQRCADLAEVDEDEPPPRRTVRHRPPSRGQSRPTGLESSAAAVGTCDGNTDEPSGHEGPIDHLDENHDEHPGELHNNHEDIDGSDVHSSVTMLAAQIPVETLVFEAPLLPGDMEPEHEVKVGEVAPSLVASSPVTSSPVALSKDVVGTHSFIGSPECPEVASLDVIGGDEIEEIVRRRPRPLRSYKIQEVITRRQILLVQVVKEERGGKGAALTTYLSLPGRYCVLMPNTGRGGGVSRKITNPVDRKRLKEMLFDLDIPPGMAVILRTAGLERSKAEIKRDLEYLLRLWDSIREQTLRSTAPELIYEEANLIKRSIRDLYSNEIDEVLVEGDQGYRLARDFMRMLVPSHAKRVQPYHDETIPLFFRYQVETQIDAVHSPVVQLKSGGYIVLNQTEALVAIDVNSGRSTRERNIEETAFKTNLEAVDEVARQLRLRDLAGLIVIDFIDMDDSRNNLAVERRLKEAMKTDRARIQLGRISPFGLLELSRQRLRPSLMETNYEKCPHCAGVGLIRSVESAALHALRAVEEEGIRRRYAEITVAVAPKVALYVLNTKRAELSRMEQRYGMHVAMLADETLIVPDLRIERVRARGPEDGAVAVFTADVSYTENDYRANPDDDDEINGADIAGEVAVEPVGVPEIVVARGGLGGASVGDGRGDRRGGRRNRRNRHGNDGAERPAEARVVPQAALEAEVRVPFYHTESEGGASSGEGEAIATTGEVVATPEATEALARKRRRGKRGGRRRGRGRNEPGSGEVGLESPEAAPDEAPEVAPDEAPEMAPDEAFLLAIPPVQSLGAAERIGPWNDEDDFDWFPDGERLAPVADTTAVDTTEVAIVPDEINAISPEVETDACSGDELDNEPEDEPYAESSSDTGPSKRIRRKSAAKATDEGDGLVARRVRRRVKPAATEDDTLPADGVFETAPETVPETVTETAPESMALQSPPESVAETEITGQEVPAEVAVVAPSAVPQATRRGWWSRD
ncbi:MAG: Rne/Rng family ribonuclease [Rhodospirillaceae bacterium]